MKKSQIIIIVLLVLLIGSFLLIKEGSMPFNKNDSSTKNFIVAGGEPLQTIVNRLEKEDLIRSRLVFYLIIKQMGYDKKIQAGEFNLSPSEDAFQIMKDLTHGTNDEKITLIEGTRIEEMAPVISKTLNIPEVAFIKEADEGYVFPDTYFIPKNANVETLLSIIKNNFYSKFNSTLHSQIKNNMSEKQVIILASLVEREARQSDTRQKVASIILKRYLDEMPLQIDATVQYALGYQLAEKSWWKKDLTIEDLKINSPYNTYLNRGLPPGPICNPSLSSIEAVIKADPTTPYWYYITDKNGVMHYAKTIEEHNANVQKYLQ